MSNSRWTDNPFRQPGLSQEQLDWLNKKNEATRIFQLTGDTTMAEDIELFPSRPRRLYEYAGHTFHVVRTSEDSAYIGLQCSEHQYHSIYIIGLTENEKSLLVGQPVENHPKYEVYSLTEALEQGAKQLHKDCTMSADNLKQQLDDFFAPTN